MGGPVVLAWTTPWGQSYRCSIWIWFPAVCTNLFVRFKNLLGIFKFKKFDGARFKFAPESANQLLKYGFRRLTVLSISTLFKLRVLLSSLTVDCPPCLNYLLDRYCSLKVRTTHAPRGARDRRRLALQNWRTQLAVCVDAHPNIDFRICICHLQRNDKLLAGN